jgi:hypothetical protein
MHSNIFLMFFFYWITGMKIYFLSSVILENKERYALEKIYYCPLIISLVKRMAYDVLIPKQQHLNELFYLRQKLILIELIL